MSKFKPINNPHSHSSASLDGAATVSSYVKHAKANGIQYLTFTEHGNMDSAMDLYVTAKKAGIKPVLGIELYMQPPFLDEISKEYLEVEDTPKMRKKLRELYVHLTVHFKDEWAFEYFSSLTPKMEERAVVRWGERKPIATIEEVAAASGHIVICSSCLVGAVKKWLLPDRVTKKVYPERAKKAYEMLRDIAGKDNFFVEIFPHKVTHEWVKPEYDKEGKMIKRGEFVPHDCTPWFPDGDYQKKANMFVYELAKSNGDPCIISLDSHFAYPDQKVVQDSKLGNGQENWRFYNSYHVMSSEESATCLKHTMGLEDKEIEQMIDNSYLWGSHFDNFKLKTKNDRWILPPLDSSWMSNLKEAINRHGRMKWNDPRYVSRLKEEMDLFTNNGRINLMPYFFTVEDIANFCRQSGILMTARGSAGGSLLLYVLGVSATDPIKYDLSLPRFLTLGRIQENTLPDVDMDFGRKDEVLQYLKSKYKDAFAPISIDSMLKLKSSIKDVERSVLGEVRQTTEDMCKKLPTSPQGSNEHEFVFGKDGHGGAIEEYPQLKKYAEENHTIWQTVSQMLGVQRQKSQHACGIVIADKPVQNYVPLIKIGKGEHYITGFSPKWVEERGLLKFDILGVNTLKDIEVCLKLVKDRHGITLDPWNLPQEKEIFDEFGKGNTASVFQFDSATVVPLLKQTKPKSIPELSNITALGRPGTLDALDEDGRTLAEVYCARAQGERVRYIHPDMEQITGESFGIALYQEQTLKIFKVLANYSDGQTETARRGIGKKDQKVLESCMTDLKDGCLSRGWNEQQFELLKQQIMASARYSFNKSHSTAYAIVAYACMYLKMHYPIEWWASVLSHSDKHEVIGRWWRHVKQYVQLPDINLSEEEFVIKDSKLISPLSMLVGVGEKAYHQLTSNKPYKDFTHFMETHFSKKPKGERSAVTSGVAQKLIIAGVLDSLLPNMTLLDKMILFEAELARIKKEKRKPISEEYSEISQLGLYLSKKSVIQAYFEDLREIVLPPRGGYLAKNGTWQYTKKEIKADGKVAEYHMVFVDGRHIEHLISNAHKMSNADERIHAIAYITEETYKKYQNTKQFTRLVADINGSVMELIYWPPWGSEIAPSGFKKSVVVIEFHLRKGRFNISSVQRVYDPKTVDELRVI